MFVGCSEPYTNSPIDEGGAAPAKVTNIQWSAVAGGVVITYDIPNDPMLYYIEASYKTASGETRCNKASVYTNQIQLDGMADTSEHLVTITSVGRNGKRSDSSSVRVTPLDPPIKDMFNNISVKAAHQGLEVSFKNTAKADMAIAVIERMADGSTAPIDTFYTSSEVGSFRVRNQTFVEHEYGIFLRDKYQNLSDTLYTRLTPLYDVKIDPSKFSRYDLPQTDNLNGEWGDYFSKFFDGNAGTGGRTNSTGFPQNFCIALGQKAKLTRFNTKYTRNTSALQGTWASGHAKMYEIYGSNNPAKDGSWESWTLIGEFTSVKPSGLPLGSCTEEDYTRACVDGEDFVFPEDIEAYEYIRIKILSVWGYAQYTFTYEWTFYGDDGNGPKPEDNGANE